MEDIGHFIYFYFLFFLIVIFSDLNDFKVFKAHNMVLLLPTFSKFMQKHFRVSRPNGWLGTRHFRGWGRPVWLVQKRWGVGGSRAGVGVRIPDEEAL